MKPVRTIIFYFFLSFFCFHTVDAGIFVDESLSSCFAVPIGNIEEPKQAVNQDLLDDDPVDKTCAVEISLPLLFSNCLSSDQSYCLIILENIWQPPEM